MKTVNLIPVKPQESVQAGIATEFFRRLSLWTLLVFVVSGMVVGGAYYYVRMRYEKAAAQKQELSQIVAQNAVKEGLLLSLKQRTALITKVFGVQAPVGKVFDIIVSFVPPAQISGVSVDERGKVSLTIHSLSIAEVISLTDTLIRYTASGRVRAPHLMSLTLGRTGGLDIGISFIAVL